MASAVEWSLTPAESRLLRLPVYVFVGVVGGLLLIVAVGGVLALAHAALSGNFLPVALVALLALVGGPISLLSLWPALRDHDQRPAFPDSPPPLSRTSTLLAVLVGATAMLASTLVTPIGPVIVLAVGLGSPVLVPFLGSKGWVDSDDGTLSVNGRDVPLATLSGIRTVEFGSVVAYWLRYEDAPLGAPRWMVVPASVADDLRTHLEDGVIAEAPAHSRQPRALRVTLVIFGIGCFAVAGGLWLAGARYVGSSIVFLPGIGLAVVFGGLFVRLALRR